MKRLLVVVFLCPEYLSVKYENVLALSFKIKTTMTNKIYYLSTCSTCQRIMTELGLDDQLEKQDIKAENINEADLIAFAKQAGSYEALFSKRALKYKSMGLKEKKLSEDDYKQLMLEEYTFLKRPFILIDGEAFIGNAKKTIEAAKTKLGL